MTFQSPFLNKINHVSEAPVDSYILYDLTGGIFFIDPKQYSNFILQWIGVQKPPSLTMDLSFARIHSPILDFDYIPPNPISINSTLENICSILKTTLLPSVTNFTYIITARKGSKGIHVHLPEFKIGYDDYILFCESFQYKFMQTTDCYKLDILCNAMLPAAAKPKKSPYVPVQIVYVDERKQFVLNLTNIDGNSMERMKKNFGKRKDNEKSIFRLLLNTSLCMWVSELKQYMMPVVDKTPYPIYTLTYASSIKKYPNNVSDWKDVAQFSFKKDDEQNFVSKCKNLSFNNHSHLLRVYHYLKLNSKDMQLIETNNHAYKMWFERCNQGNASSSIDTHIPKIFRNIHQTLQFDHANLADNPNPIKTIMQFNEGYYFLPVFYVLCKHCKIDSVSMANELYLLLDKKFHPLLDKIRSFNPKNIEFTYADISLNTLHFCANNLYDESPKSYKDKLKSIVQNNKRAILSVITYDQMVELIRNIQDRHLPIRYLKLKSALKKPSKYIWNSLSESWQEVSPAEITDHIRTLWNYIEQFLRDCRAQGQRGGPDEELLNNFPLTNIVSAISTESSMERKDIQMDNHKWFLRLQDGVLDLLTGHIGGVVPEFFLSDRKINIGIAREEMIKLCNDSPKHVALYETLTNQQFFLKYLQNLFLDVTDNLYDTLQQLVGSDDNLSESMLHFYINLCKCMSFEHDVIMYMLDVLASIFIGSNYERKFFVLKGLTRNGKSKLFELMGRVLGGYYHSIQSENLASGNAGNNATPELASTLFSCRMVASEELEKKLNENRVKQITGNSFVTFRNLYEANSGGIPTAKIFVTTNNYPECKASEAFKDRVVAIPFDAEFTDNAPSSTSEQVGTNTFQKDVYVVEQSFKGCFFMLYYHLKKFINLDNGLLHYRDRPEYVVEFTNDYLDHADIYVQFKLFMDVQIIPGTITTLNDVKSAVRQYLKTTRNTSFHETDLIVSFEKEFGHLRRSDVDLKEESFNYTSVFDEPAQKKAKVSNDDLIVVFYEDVVIKNLRKVNVDA